MSRSHDRLESYAGEVLYVGDSEHGIITLQPIRPKMI